MRDNYRWIAEQNLRQQAEKQLADLKNRLKTQQNSIMKDKQTGLASIGGGINRYGELRPGQLTLRDMSGNLDPRFQQSLGSAYQSLEEQAMAPGLTEGAQLAQEQQGIMQQADIDRMRQMQASGVAQGMRNLAMRGGVSTGARERLQRDASRQGMLGMQGIGRESRLANLNIAQQDAATKLGLLGKVGQAQQIVQAENINRLAGDINNQNLASQKMYEEDMRAFGAQQTAAAQRSSSCFTAETKFRMANGDYKYVGEIDLGDELYEGGHVYLTLRAKSDDLYLYDDSVRVAGSHAVKENGKWIRVKDSDKAQKIEGIFTVYNVASSNHLMLTENHVFADFHETDHGDTIGDRHALDILNGKYNR